MARNTRRSKTNTKLPAWVKTTGRIYWQSKGKTALLQAGPGMCVAAEVLSTAPDGTKTAATLGALAIGGATAWAKLPGVAVAVPFTKRSVGWKRQLPSRRDTVWGLSAAVTGAALLTAATSAGGPELGENPHWGLGAAWGLTYGIWWWRLRARGHQAPELAGAERIVAVWAEHVDAERGLHPGTKLTEVAVTADGSWDAVAVAPPGRGCAVTVDQVASLYGVPADRVTVRPVPDAPPNLARIAVSLTARQVGELTGIEEKLALWGQYIGAAGGHLPGSRLEDVEDTGNGWRAVVVAKRGGSVTALKLDDIVSTYQVDTSRVSYVGMSGRPYMAELTVMDRNPLEDGVEFTTADVIDSTTGLATIGVHDDGTPATYRFWEPGSGTASSLVVGSTGSGKSRLLDELLVIERRNGMISWVLDAQSGQSVPDWARDVDYYAAGALASWRALLAAEEVMLSRSARYAAAEWTDEKGRRRRGYKEWVPGRQDPILSVTLEEFAFLVKRFPKAAEKAANIAKMGRKCGVRVRIVLQDPKVDELGSGTLREQLQQGTIVLLRTGGKTSGRLALGGSLDAVNPAAIPARFSDGSGTQGLGYIANGSTAQGRMFRAAWVKDPLDWIDDGRQEQRLERASVDAAGLWYARYREWLDADRRGEDVPPEPPGNEPEEGQETPARVRSSEPAGVAKARSSASEAPSRVSERLVALLRDAGGPMARQQLVAALADEGIEVKPNAVSAALKRRAATGDVVTLGHGLWAHTAHAEALAA